MLCALASGKVVVALEVSYSPRFKIPADILREGTISLPSPIQHSL
jgi:hypothetical protein